MAQQVNLPTFSSTGYERAAGILRKLACAAQNAAQRHERKVVVRESERLYAIRTPGQRTSSQAYLEPQEVLELIGRGFVVTAI